MKIRKSYSKEILLENCEDVAIEISDTFIPAKNCTTNLLTHNDSINRSEEIHDRITSQIQSENKSLNQENHVEIEIPLFVEKGTTSINNRTQLPWYRNWTNAGIALCVVYNLAILFLLILGLMQFGSS